MTKSELFKSAHAMAKATVEAVGNYMVAFKLALKFIHSEAKTPKRRSMGRRASSSSMMYKFSYKGQVYFAKDSDLELIFKDEIREELKKESFKNSFTALGQIKLSLYKALVTKQLTLWVNNHIFTAL